MKLNCFKVKTGKPMVYSFESAKEFLAQCKVAFDLKMPDRKTFFTFYAGDDKIPCKVGAYELVDEWVDYQVTAFYGIDAIRACYRLRKYINAYFLLIKPRKGKENK